ncbi:MAG: tetratricopeptide repeat protein, partial [Syntrophobacteraceae bacterium]
AMGRPEEAVAAYDSVVERFGESEDPRLLERVATALVNKGCALGAMGRPEEAVAAYDSVVERFGESEDPRLLEPVAKAHNDKAWTIYQQKIITRLDAAIQAAANAVRLFPNNNHFRHTLASVYSLAGRWSEAFEQAVLFADDSKLIENCPDEIMNFFISAAAAGKAEAALKTIQKTAAVTGLEPLVAALKISAGADFQAPKEVMEVALDIVKKIGNSGGTIPNF